MKAALHVEILILQHTNEEVACYWLSNEKKNLLMCQEVMQHARVMYCLHMTC